MTPADARAAIRALRVGSAAVHQADLLSVGLGEIRAHLEKEVGRLAAGDEVVPVLVEGAWGSGKSHTLAMIKALARIAGVPTAAVTFNARVAPLSHPNRVYPILAQTLELGGAVGIRSVLRRLLHDETHRAQIAAFAENRVDAFGAAVGELCRAYASGDVLLLGRSGAWSTLLGADLAVRDHLARKQAAVRRLHGLADLLKACNLGGLVVLGDELESLALLWSSVSRAGAYNAIGSLIATRSILWVFGAAGNFQRMVAHDVDQGMHKSWRLKDTGRQFIDGWRTARFHHLSTAVLGKADADCMARLVADVYQLGYGLDSRRVEPTLRAVTQAWFADPGRNPRRLARGLVEALDDLRGAPRFHALPDVAVPIALSAEVRPR